ncbi:hypothetical protein RYZ26_19780 [Terasakiella sp. A23]|uniref:hypothetical protein n=1 Tax=Terasakiella sp. FCG-A23 TaxID=3080561 RepID=UPI002955173E|nr:hypothetical protein [Terasakiella sp. A23]MDV7341846.1 hypothetical protein [Terasakiella sp. A23]
MLPQVQFHQEYSDLVITAEVPVIPIGDCSLLLVIRYGEEREVVTSPVGITSESFPLICDAIWDGYQTDRSHFWIMDALGQLSLELNA